MLPYTRNTITYNIPRGRGSYFDILLVRRARMAQVPIKTVVDFSEIFRLGLTAFNAHVIIAQTLLSFMRSKISWVRSGYPKVKFCVYRNKISTGHLVSYSQ